MFLYVQSSSGTSPSSSSLSSSRRHTFGGAAAVGPSWTGRTLAGVIMNSVVPQPIYRIAYITSLPKSSKWTYPGDYLRLGR